MKKISQRAARGYLKRVKELENTLYVQRRTYSQEWPGGQAIGMAIYPVDHPVTVAIRTARMLQHAVVAVVDDDKITVRFVALPSARAPE